MLLSADVGFLVSSFIIAQQTPVFIRYFINAAKLFVIFLFFEFGSGPQPHNKMHNSHAALLVNFILENDG